MTKTYKRYSDDPVEIGMIRYVGMGEPLGPTYCCVVTKIDGEGLGEQRVWDEEFRCWGVTYVYLCRRATSEEEAVYKAIPSYSDQVKFRVAA